MSPMPTRLRSRNARGRVPPKLSDAQRDYIVRRLAADDLPAAIRREVRQRFGIEISWQTITYYDPSRVPACGKRWAELYHTVRKERIAGRAELTSMAGRIERLALRIVAILESRAVEGREARGCAKDASAITDEDRLRALLAFCERLRITDPAGFAAIRRVLDDDDAGAPRAPRRSQGGSHAD